MILFQATEGWEIDLTEYGLTLNEFSDYFYKLTQKNYSWPLNIELDDTIAAKLNLIDQENITDYKVRIDGNLIEDNQFYPSYMTLNQIQGTKAEATFYYGNDILSVFSKTMKQLPFPIIDVGISLNTYASLQVAKAWPIATHNFPKVYRPQIRELEKYNAFRGFMNDSTNGVFRANVTNTVNGEEQTLNYNVLAPCPYLLEILRVMFKSEGLDIRGDFVNDELIQKVLYIPRNFFEYYSDPTQRNYFNFRVPVSESFDGTRTLKTYQKDYIPQKNGTYIIDAKLNFPKGKADYFKMNITYGATVIYSVFVENQAIELDRRFEINVQGDDFSTIRIELITPTIGGNFAQFNSFAYDFLEGRQNVFPTQYTLSDILPDTLVRNFYNYVKEFFNLDVTFTKNAVYLNYMDDSIKKLIFDDHSEYQQPKPKRVLNANNLFKLISPNEEFILISKKGQVFSDDDFTEKEIENISLQGIGVKVSKNEGLTTGVFPDADSEMVFGIYDGLQDNEPLLIDAVNGRDLSLQSIYDNNHANFLSFRANSETYKDKFDIPFSKGFNLKRGIFKYGKKHLIKNLRKRRKNANFWTVDMETESF